MTKNTKEYNIFDARDHSIQEIVMLLLLPK